MRMDAKIDILKLVDKTAKAQKNLAFSVVQGINATALKIQEAQRENLAKNFTLRTRNTTQFMQRQVAIIRPFASVGRGRIYAEVAVGQRSKLLLGGYEDGVAREPFRGKLIAQPVAGNAARPNFKDPVKQQFTFKAMALKSVKTKAGGKRFEGRNGTYTVEKVGVFLRTGRGREGSELIYAFAEHQKLPKKLGWLKRAEAVTNRWLSENITQAFLRSLPRN